MPFVIICNSVVITQPARNSFCAEQGFFSAKENFRTRDAVECFNVFPSAENSRGMFSNSTYRVEPLFIRLDNL